MAKFKVGDEVAIAALVKITAIQELASGKVTYATDRGFCIHEVLMDEIALNPKEPKAEEPKPAPQPAHRFKVGDRVVDDNFGTGTIFEMDDVILEDIPYHVRFSDRIMWLGDKDLTPAPEPPKFYTGKVVMVDCEFPDRKHLINHLFEFKNGRQVGNKMHGMSFNHAPYTSFEQIVSTHNASTWIEVKSDV